MTEVHYSPEPPTESDLAIHGELIRDDLEFVELLKIHSKGDGHGH